MIIIHHHHYDYHHNHDHHNHGHHPQNYHHHHLQISTEREFDISCFSVSKTNRNMFRTASTSCNDISSYNCKVCKYIVFSFLLTSQFLSYMSSLEIVCIACALSDRKYLSEIYP